MPKRRTSPPPREPRFLKFRFHVPLIVPIIAGAARLTAAREKLEGMLRHGDFVLNIDAEGAKPIRRIDKDSWIPEIAWTCPYCNKENWFRLDHERTCQDRCPGCDKIYIIIEGFIHRMQTGCESCDRRIDCMLTPRAEVVTMSAEEAL